MAVLRQQAATLLGYKNYADYIIEVKMAKTSKTVLDFLDDLQTKMTPIGQMEKLRLLELKKAECKERGWEYNGELMLWDYRYYDQRYLAKTLLLGSSHISSPFESVLTFQRFLQTRKLSKPTSRSPPSVPRSTTSTRSSSTSNSIAFPHRKAALLGTRVRLRFSLYRYTSLTMRCTA